VPWPEVLGQSPAHVQTYLKGIDYPARKEDLIQKARANGAPGEVMDLLQKVPAEQYGGPGDVMRAYGQVK
jgi:hypothetical protein